MNHFINLADFNSRYVRYGLVAIHVPVLAVCLVLHTVGGLLTHSNNYLVQILNATTGFAQNLMGHVVGGVSSMVVDIRTVIRGRE
jgi:hypothetical protein